MQQMAEYLFHEGRNFHSYDYLGNFLTEEGCIFRVWAPKCFLQSQQNQLMFGLYLQVG